MTSIFLVVFRESLEAALILSIILATLQALAARSERRVVLVAAGMGFLGSIAGALLWKMTLGEFEGRAEEAFEGILMLLAAGPSALLDEKKWTTHARPSLQKDSGGSHSWRERRTLPSCFFCNFARGGGGDPLSQRI